MPLERMDRSRDRCQPRGRVPNQAASVFIRCRRRRAAERLVAFGDCETPSETSLAFAAITSPPLTEPTAAGLSCSTVRGVDSKPYSRCRAIGRAPRGAAPGAGQTELPAASPVRYIS